MSYLIDTTLRDGEQAAGVAFDRKARVAIARKLAAVGIAELEVGIPAMGPREESAVREIVDLGLPCRILTWGRAHRGDLQAAVRTGAHGFHFSLPASPIHQRMMGWSGGRVLDELAFFCGIAADAFGYFSVGAQDASRADPVFLGEFAALAGECGARRIRFADTVGCLHPGIVGERLEALRQRFSGEIEFHGHNDLGMAVANSLSALLAGADAVSVTVNGLGERAGNAALEELVVAAHRTSGIELGVKTEGLMDLSQMVAERSGQGLRPEKPIVGSQAFRHESGIHVRGVLQDAATYEAFDPALVGAKRPRFVIGRHSGTAALRQIGEELGWRIDEAGARLLLPRVRIAAERIGRALNEGELVVLFSGLEPNPMEEVA